MFPTCVAARPSTLEGARDQRTPHVAACTQAFEKTTDDLASLSIVGTLPGYVTVTVGKKFQRLWLQERRWRTGLPVPPVWCRPAGGRPPRTSAADSGETGEAGGSVHRN